ncbi:hypothetical protein PR202_ga14129 [Eleusine coracana subsp. coracana]|uniref:Uncharacterized protein n=1 Tax=Eleusine coracana subsp. coracana TaxID=191504 RepID=A0AAV5CGI8_ELECO|nr:hypothetical protein PR202_ga14129 [Eleusine coracana subsp. coracana]
MDAEMKDADTQTEIEWDGGGGRADAMLGPIEDGASVSLCYYQAYGPHDDILLLEAADDLLPDLLQGRVIVRGRPDEEAVLCTPSTTPDNTNGDVVAAAIKLAPGSIELIQTAPRLDKLRNLLRERPYVLDERILGMTFSTKRGCTHGKTFVNLSSLVTVRCQME